MGNVYIFVIAAALAVFSISIIFKISMDAIKEEPEKKNQVQTKFFIWLAISEIIPIILIVFGFINLESVPTIEALYVPGLIVIVLVGFAALFITLQRIVGVPSELKPFVKSFASTALATTISIPIIAIVAMMTMMP